MNNTQFNEIEGSHFSIIVTAYCPFVFVGNQTGDLIQRKTHYDHDHSRLICMNGWDKFMKFPQFYQKDSLALDS